MIWHRKCVLGTFCLGLLLLAGSVTAGPLDVDPCAVVLIYGFDEGEQPQGSYTGPFPTADETANGNDGAVTHGNYDEPFTHGPAFNAGGAPQTTNFVSRVGPGGAPAGPAPITSGSYIAMHADFVDIPSPTSGNVLSFATNDDFTIEFWFRTGEHTFRLFGLDVGSPEYPKIQVFMEGAQGNGRVAVQLNDDLNSQIALLTTGTYNDNQWHHIAIQKEGLTARLIMDGGAETQSAATGYGFFSSEPYTGTHRFNGNSDNTFTSIVQYDELRVSKTAVAVSDLGYHGSVIPSEPIDPTQAALLYEFDTAPGVYSEPNEPDLASGNHDGSIVDDLNTTWGYSGYWAGDSAGHPGPVPNDPEMGNWLYLNGRAVGENMGHIIVQNTDPWPEWSATDSWTIEFWFNYFGGGSSGHTALFHMGATVDTNPGIRIWSWNGGAELQARLEGPGFEHHIAAGSINPNEWYHVALQQDGAAGKVRFLVNGGADYGGVTEERDLDPDVAFSINYFQINGDTEAWYKALLGIERFTIWNRALAPAELDYVRPCAPGTATMLGDINEDCWVDFVDFALLAGQWLSCTDPNPANCP